MALVKTRTFSQFSKIVVVTDKSQLAGDLSSGVEYFLDGIIDMGNQPIVIPQGGITFVGYSFDLSGLISSEDNYTMFTSPAGGSGNFLGKDYLISVTGTNSRVYNIVSDTGNEAFEFERVNYNNCTSLGVIDNYRQGLESDTGRFGGTPTLELAGAWTGGYRITTSIVRNISDSPVNGRLRHLGSTQREFSVVVDLVIDGPQNDEVQILIKKWDDSASTLTTAASQRRTVNALAGGRDVAFFTFITPVKLDQNDYIKIMIKNNSSTGDLTAELDSFITITEQ